MSEEHQAHESKNETSRSVKVNEDSNSNWVGYCTNVHAGVDLDSVMANLEKYAVPIQVSQNGDRPLGVGLWLANEATATCLDRIGEFRQFLDARKLVPFTFNAFPFSNFHQPVVKHDVYFPAWNSLERLEYTKRIIQIGHLLLPTEQTLSVSTLPLGWPNDDTEELKTSSANNLIELARYLAELESQSNRTAIVCLETEPGCVLQTSQDLVSFFQDHLLERASSSDRENIHRFLGACHDVCHAAVMFEDQGAVLDRFSAAEIKVGKMQVSSAIRAFVTPETRTQIIHELAGFAEERYLHQTTIKQGNTVHFFEDLPMAIDNFPAENEFEIRSHFHVPIFLENCGVLQTTQSEIVDCLSELDVSNTAWHFEIETYAWDVSPENIRGTSLGDSITQELTWFNNRLDDVANSAASRPC